MGKKKTMPQEGALLEADYRLAMGSEEELVEKDWNLVQNVGNESSGGLWGTEIRAFADAQTLASLHATEDWVFIPVDRIASKISAQRLLVVKDTMVGKKVVTEEDEGHPVQAMIDEPNQYQDYHSFMYCVATQLPLQGNAIIWRARAMKQMICLPTQYARIEFDKNAEIKEYQLYQGDREDNPQLADYFRFKPEEITHIRRPNPSSMMWGLSPLIPGTKSVLFNRYSSEYLNNYYLKGAQPGLALTMGKEANEKLALRLLRSMEAAYTGRRNQRKSLILPKGVDVKEISHKLADQDLAEYLMLNRETIINLFQVPKHELSIEKGGGLGNKDYEVAMRTFWTGPLRFYMRLIAGALTKSLQRELGPGYRLEFDTSDVEALRDDGLTKATLATAMLKTHTVNEVRAEIYDLAPIVGGSAFEAPKTGLDASSMLAIRQLVIDVAAGAMPQAAASQILISAFGFTVEDSVAVFSNVVYGSAKPAPAALPASSQPLPASSQPLPAASQPPPAPDETPKAEETGITTAAVGDPSSAPLAVPQDKKAVLEKNTLAMDGHIKANEGWWQDRKDKLAAAGAAGEEKVRSEWGKVAKAQASAVSDVVTKYLKAFGRLRVKAADGEDKPKVPNPATLSRKIRQAMQTIEDQYVEGTTDQLAATMELGYDAELTVPFDLPAKDQLAALKKRGADGRKQILEARQIDTFANMTATSTDRVMQIITDGVEGSKTIAEISRDIRDELGSSSRADLVARTEALTATSLGQAAAVKDVADLIPDLKKVWMNAGDERVRGNPGGIYAKSKSDADHWSMQGETVAHDADFSNGCAFPRDPKGSASETINCRCTMVMVPGDMADQLGLEGLHSDEGDGG
jgi:HK97 family phage portal protein